MHMSDPVTDALKGVRIILDDTTIPGRIKVDIIAMLIDMTYCQIEEESETESDTESETETQTDPIPRLRLVVSKEC